MLRILDQALIKRPALDKAYHSVGAYDQLLKLASKAFFQFSDVLRSVAQTLALLSHSPV